MLYSREPPKAHTDFGHIGLKLGMVFALCSWIRLHVFAGYLFIIINKSTNKSPSSWLQYRSELIIRQDWKRVLIYNSQVLYSLSNFRVLKGKLQTLVLNRLRVLASGLHTPTHFLLFWEYPSQVKWSRRASKKGTIDHCTVVCSVTSPLNGSEAGGDLVLIQTSLFLLCKSSCSYAY